MQLSNQASRSLHPFHVLPICVSVSLKLQKPMLRALPRDITGPSAFHEMKRKKSFAQRPFAVLYPSSITLGPKGPKFAVAGLSNTTNASFACYSISAS
jgi:hypothetical protein